MSFKIKPTLCLLGATFLLILLGYLVVLLMGTGLPFLTAISAVAACRNVLGPAIGDLGAKFQPVNDAGTWILFLRHGDRQARHLHHHRGARPRLLARVTRPARHPRHAARAPDCG